MRIHGPVEKYDIDTQIEIAATNSALIEMLDAVYPERSPRLEDTERQIWMNVGVRELIRHLIHLRDEDDRLRRGF